MKNKKVKIGSIVRYYSSYGGLWRYSKVIDIEGGQKLWGYWTYDIKKLKTITAGLGWMHIKDIEVMEDNPNNNILL